MLLFENPKPDFQVFLKKRLSSTLVCLSSVCPSFWVLWHSFWHVALDQRIQTFSLTFKSRKFEFLRLLCDNISFLFISGWTNLNFSLSGWANLVFNRGVKCEKILVLFLNFRALFIAYFFNTIVECHGLCERLRYVVKKLRMDSQLTQDGRSSSFTGLFSV